MKKIVLLVVFMSAFLCLNVENVVALELNENKTNYIKNSDGDIVKSEHYSQTGNIWMIKLYYDDATMSNKDNKVKNEFLLDNEGYIQVAHKYEEKTHKILTSYEYYDKTVFGNHGDKIKIRYTYDESQYIKYGEVFESKTGKIVKKLLYYPKANYKNKDVKLKYEFILKGNIVKLAHKYSNKKKINSYEYYDNTIYGKHANNIKVTHFYGSNGYIEKSNLYKQGSKQLTAINTYYSNANLDNYSSRVYIQFFINPDGTIKLANKLENNSQKILNSYKYLKGTVHGKHATNIVTRYDYDSAQYIHRSINYKNSAVKTIYTYNPKTSLENINSNILFKYDIVNDYINNAFKYDNGRVIAIYEYYPETKFGNHSKNIKYRFQIDKNDHISAGYGFIKGNQTYDKIYNYLPNTKYGNHGTKISKKFELDADGNIYNSTQYSANKKVSVFEYYPNTKYKDYKSHVKYVFEFDSHDNLKLGKKLHDNSQKIQRLYEYYPNTKYGSHLKRIKYRLDLNSEGHIIHAVKFSENSSKIINHYEYYSNVKYGDQAKRIKYKFTMDKNDNVVSANQFQDYTKRNLGRFEYYPNAKYGKHGGKIKYNEKYHYAKNGNITFTTKTKYDSKGRKYNIDSNSRVTYYTQYTQQNFNYSCPNGGQNIYYNGCFMHSFSMFYSIFFDNELTPIRLYNQGFRCLFIPTKAGEKNGLNVVKVKPKSNNKSQNVVLSNNNGVVPNGKSTFTLTEALRDYGMPVQLHVQSREQKANGFPGHSIIATRYVYENGKGTIYIKDPTKPDGKDYPLDKWLRGDYYSHLSDWTIIQAWTGNTK